MKTWIFGNSHTAALSKGLREIDTPGRNVGIFALGSGAVETGPFSALRDGKLRFTDENYDRNLRRFTQAGHLRENACWGVCMGTHNARICRNDFWRGAEPAAICTPGKRPVPETTVDAIIETDQRHVKALLSNMKRAGLPVFVVSCPPLRPDLRDPANAPRPEVAAFLDARARAAFTDFLDDAGIPFVPPPAESVSPDGFLVDQFHATVTPKGLRDPHHANVAYGKLMMQKVLAFLDSAELPKPGKVA